MTTVRFPVVLSLAVLAVIEAVVLGGCGRALVDAGPTGGGPHSVSTLSSGGAHGGHGGSVAEAEAGADASSGGFGGADTGIDATDAGMDAADATETVPDADAADSSLACGAGLTGCPSGDGGQACVDLQTDPANCGACNAPPCLGAVCSGGKWASDCGGGDTLCELTPDAACPGFYCANTGSDPKNCSACNIQCAPGLVCSGGQCGSPKP